MKGAGRRLGARRVGAAAGALVAVALAGLLAAAPAAGWIPSVERVARATARTNDAAGRDRALRLELAVWPDPAGAAAAQAPAAPAPGGEPPGPAPEAPLATGTLLADPSGRARLELRHRDGFRERHLLRGAVVEASRDGAPLADPLPLLPPLAPLQAASSSALLGWLATQGAPRRAELGHEGAHDAIVLGGRGGGAAVWVDQEGWSIVRIDRRDGTRFHLGPPRDFGGLRLPAWIAIESPGAPPLRLDIRDATATTASPDAFSPTWLREPPPPPPPTAPSPPAPPTPAPPPTPR